MKRMQITRTITLGDEDARESRSVSVHVNDGIYVTVDEYDSDDGLVEIIIPLSKREASALAQLLIDAANDG